MRTRPRPRPVQDDFHRVNVPRVQQIVHKLGLIRKSAKSYRAAPDALAAILRPVHEALGVGAVPTSEPKPRPTKIPEGTAQGGSTFEAEIRWAYDAVQRGDTKLAANRLRRILDVVED